MTDTKSTLTVNHRCSLDLVLWPKPLEAIRTLANTAWTVEAQGYCTEK